MNRDIVKIGRVTAVNGTKARVAFPDTGITSDWLSVLQRPEVSVSTTIAEAEDHTHGATSRLSSWIPAINAVVVVLYLLSENGDGFILGEIT